MFEQTFKNIDDVLWKEAGCTTELDYTEQTSWLLFLKYPDDLERERKLKAELEGTPHDRIVRGEYRWSAWAAPKDRQGRLDHDAALTGDDLIGFVDDELFPYLRDFRQRAGGPDTIEYRIGEIFGEIGNRFRSGHALRDAPELVDRLRFNTQDEKHELPHLHPCPCQKQPCTKTTLRREGNTMSGVPGRSRRWSLNRYPSRCRARRSASSGFVSLCPTFDIMYERRSAVTWSVIGTIFGLDRDGPGVGFAVWANSAAYSSSLRWNPAMVTAFFRQWTRDLNEHQAVGELGSHPGEHPSSQSSIMSLSCSTRSWTSSFFSEAQTIGYIVPPSNCEATTDA